MDGSRFDSLTKHFAGSLSRRSTLGGVLAGILTPLGVLGSPTARAQADQRAEPETDQIGAEDCLRNGKRCGKRRGKDDNNNNEHPPCKRCCSRYAVKGKSRRRRCACRPIGKSCGKDRQCCSRQCQGGSCVGGGPGPSCDVCASGCAFTSVQAAIEAAAPGATITVCPGTYTENLFIEQNVEVIGAGDGDGPNDTILQAADDASVVRVESGTVSLRQLRITGGGGGFGAGVDNAGDVTLTNCTLTGNVASDSGGALFNNGGSTATLDTCTVSDNQAPRGAISNQGDLIVTDSVIVDNTCEFFCGIDNNGGTATITGTEISGHVVTDDVGGGLANSGTMELTDSSVSDNEADEGGGIYNTDVLSLINTDITGNTARVGGGISNSGTLTLDTASSVTGNHATSDNAGGGILNNGTVTCAAATVTGNTEDDPPVPSNCLDDAGTGCDTCNA